MVLTGEQIPRIEGEVGLPEGDGVILGLGIMRGDNDDVDGVTDRDRARSVGFPAWELEDDFFLTFFYPFT